MRRFNLQEALAGEAVCTRDGRPVMDLHYFANAKRHTDRVVGLLDGYVFTWFEDGTSAPVQGVRSEARDLFMREGEDETI